LLSSVFETINIPVSSDINNLPFDLRRKYYDELPQLNFSRIKLLLESKKAFLKPTIQKTTTYFEFGCTFHLAMHETLSNYPITETTKPITTKDVITPSLDPKIRPMIVTSVNKLLRNKIPHPDNEILTEIVCFDNDYKAMIDCKYRLHTINGPEEALVDFKTTFQTNQTKLLNTITKYHYDKQIAFYHRFMPYTPKILFCDKIRFMPVMVKVNTLPVIETNNLAKNALTLFTENKS